MVCEHISLWSKLTTIYLKNSSHFQVQVLIENVITMHGLAKVIKQKRYLITQTCVFIYPLILKHQLTQFLSLLKVYENHPFAVYSPYGVIISAKHYIYII